MSFNVISPIAINDTIFTGSNVPEADLQEWSAGTAYAVGDTVMVATSVANVHKTYECLVAQSAGLTANLLDEDCSDISDWTDGDTINSVSEVSPDGQFRFDTNLGAAGNGLAKRKRTIASPPNTFTLEIKTYFDALGTFANADYAKIEYSLAAWRFQIEFCSEGMFIYKALGAKTEIGSAIIKSNATAAWQTWRFQVDRTVVANATVEVFLKEEGGIFVSKGTVDCDQEYTGEGDGVILFLQAGYGTDNMLSHIDYIKVATGLGAIANIEATPVGNTAWLETDSTNRWKAFNGVLGSQTSQATKIEYVLTPGAVIDSVALLNLESDTIDIVEIDNADNLVTNGTAWTGATGTTPPTGWIAVLTPTDFTIDGGMIRITVDAANEGMSQTITVVAATEYQLVGLYKNTAGDLAQYSVRDMTNAVDIKATTDLTSSTVNSSFSYVFTTPAGCVSVKISFMAKANGDIVWFDSIILAPTEYSETVTTGTAKTDVVKLDIPQRAAGILTVTINKSTTAAIGELIIGIKTSLGKMLYNPQIGFRNYSTKTQDTFGNWTIVVRGYSKKFICSLILENTTIDAVFKFLCDHKDDMLVWVGSETYNSLIVYGFCKEPQIVIPYQSWSNCSLEIEGII